MAWAQWPTYGRDLPGPPSWRTRRLIEVRRMVRFRTGLYWDKSTRKPIRGIENALPFHSGRHSRLPSATLASSAIPSARSPLSNTPERLARPAFAAVSGDRNVNAPLSSFDLPSVFVGDCVLCRHSACSLVTTQSGPDCRRSQSFESRRPFASMAIRGHCVLRSSKCLSGTKDRAHLPA
jgi:hypothetical protein